MSSVAGRRCYFIFTIASLPWNPEFDPFGVNLFTVQLDLALEA
jgi:hypothetical protein